jgi:hypothetical protein
VKNTDSSPPFLCVGESKEDLHIFHKGSEAKLLVSMPHPNLVAFKGFFREEPCSIMMEYLVYDFSPFPGKPPCIRFLYLYHLLLPQNRYYITKRKIRELSLKKNNGYLHNTCMVLLA